MVTFKKSYENLFWFLSRVPDIKNTSLDGKWGFLLTDWRNWSLWYAPSQHFSRLENPLTT